MQAGFTHNQLTIVRQVEGNTGFIMPATHLRDALHSQYTAVDVDGTGIITEHGGATCHAAVLARTMGIPCITGVDQATKLLSSGQLVHLEAQGLMEPGTVEVME